MFCADRILEDSEKLQYYTGFSSRSMVMACCTFLEEGANTRRTWHGSRTNFGGDRQGANPGPPSKLGLVDQFFSFVFVFAVVFPWMTWQIDLKSPSQP